MPPQNGKLKLRDIARLTGHTVGTVSKALHDKPGLAPKTREYILKVARENEADLIVMAHHSSDLSDDDADIGSTVEQVVLRSACPVASVTRPEAR